MNKDNKEIKKYIDFYMEHSDIIEKINKYKPDYKRRKEMVQVILNDYNWVMEGNSFIFMMSKELRDFFVKKGLNEDFIYSEFNNGVTAGATRNISVVLNKTNPNYMENFYLDFEKHFNGDKEKKFKGTSTFRTLANYRLLDLNENDALEDEKESKMAENLKIFLDVEFPKIKDFIMNYNFQSNNNI